MSPNVIKETEFGVPFPGKVLLPEQWAKTALKKLPEQGPANWPEIFAREAPLVIDVGCGNGRFILGSASTRRELNHLGIDILPLVLRYATRRANHRGLANVRFAACDGLRLLEKYVARGSVQEIHSYHPQPYHEPGQANKRLWTPALLARVHESLEPSGLLVVQTDNGPYWQYLRTILPAVFDFHEQEGPWPDAPKGRTRREILARHKGLKVHRGWGRALVLSEDEVRTRVEKLPWPRFDAGPGNRELDILERENTRL